MAWYGFVLLVYKLYYAFRSDRTFTVWYEILFGSVSLVSNRHLNFVLAWRITSFINTKRVIITRFQNPRRNVMFVPPMTDCEHQANMGKLPTTRTG